MYVIICCVLERIISTSHRHFSWTVLPQMLLAFTISRIFKVVSTLSQTSNLTSTWAFLFLNYLLFSRKFHIILVVKLDLRHRLLNLSLVNIVHSILSTMKSRDLVAARATVKSSVIMHNLYEVSILHIAQRCIRDTRDQVSRGWFESSCLVTSTVFPLVNWCLRIWSLTTIEFRELWLDGPLFFLFFLFFLLCLLLGIVGTTQWFGIYNWLKPSLFVLHFNFR